MPENHKPDPAFASRVEQICSMVGGAAELARKSGLSRRVIDKYAAAGSDPSRQRLIQMANAAGVSLRWLATGEGPMNGGLQIDQLEPSGHDDDRALLPLYEVDASGGSGLLAISECVEDRIGFSKAWLTRHQINAACAGLVRVRGDSMAPTVPDGALVLIDTSRVLVEREGIYVFSRDGETFVKRLVPLAQGPGGVPTSVVIISDGGTFPPEFVTGPPLNDIRVVGRVRCIIATV